MNHYKRYEIEKRKYSSNVVVGVYDSKNENGKVVEKRDIVICPVLKKEDGDAYAAEIVEYMNYGDALKVAYQLSKVGFLCEIVTDGWANWKFNSEGRPDCDTAFPLYMADPNEFNTKHVAWRGCYWYFDKETHKLQQDDVGLRETPALALLELINTYKTIQEHIDINAFNEKKHDN